MIKKTFIIAEAGVNHNGNLDLAKKLIDVASNSGADAVKFQTFDPDELVTQTAEKAAYQIKQDGKSSQHEMLKRLALKQEDFLELYTYCGKKNILFMSSPFDLKSVDTLAQLDMSIFKIPSGEITNLPLLRKIGALKKQVILSTGMANIEEISAALTELIKSGTDKSKITILQCTTEYPAPFESIHLLAMNTIRQEFATKVGYSDHTIGIEAAIAATALGATVIEKHFTLDRSLPGPDHKASLEPQELKAMVDAIRNVELCLGTNIKQPNEVELKNLPFARKSIVAAEDIMQGTIFTEKNLTTKRPANGLSPMKWDSILGQKAKKSFKRDEPIVL